MCFTTTTPAITTNESAMSSRNNHNTRTLRRKKRSNTAKSPYSKNSTCSEEKELSSFFHRSLSCLFTTTSSSVQEELEPHKLNSPKKRRLSSASTGTLPTCPSSDASFSSATPSFVTTSNPSHLPLPTTISTQSISSTTTSSGLQHKHKSRSIGKLSQKDSLCSLGGLLVSGYQQRQSPPASDSSVVACSDATTDSLRSCTLSQYLSDLDASFDSRARFHRSQDDDDDDDSLSYSDDSSLGDQDQTAAVGWYVDSSPQNDADDDEEEEDAIFF